MGFFHTFFLSSLDARVLNILRAFFWCFCYYVYAYHGWFFSPLFGGECNWLTQNGHTLLLMKKFQFSYLLYSLINTIFQALFLHHKMPLSNYTATALNDFFKQFRPIHSILIGIFVYALIRCCFTPIDVEKMGEFSKSAPAVKCLMCENFDIAHRGLCIF